MEQTMYTPSKAFIRRNANITLSSALDVNVTLTSVPCFAIRRNSNGQPSKSSSLQKMTSGDLAFNF